MKQYLLSLWLNPLAIQTQLSFGKIKVGFQKSNIQLLCVSGPKQRNLTHPVSSGECEWNMEGICEILKIQIPFINRWEIWTLSLRRNCPKSDNSKSRLDWFSNSQFSGWVFVCLFLVYFLLNHESLSITNKIPLFCFLGIEKERHHNHP